MVGGVGAATLFQAYPCFAVQPEPSYLLFLGFGFINCGCCSNDSYSRLLLMWPSVTHGSSSTSAGLNFAYFFFLAKVPLPLGGVPYQSPQLLAH